MSFEDPNNFHSFYDTNIKSHEENRMENPVEKNDFIINEKLLNKFHRPITLKQTEKILEQLKYTICSIILKGGGRGTGFFMKIKFPNNESLLPVLLTCNHVINESFFSKRDKIYIQVNDKLKVIELKNRIIYSNKEIDITIIEIKKKDEIENFLLLDEENQDNKISGQTIYLLQYSDPNEPSVTYGIAQYLELDNLSFGYYCSTTPGASGSPILNLANNKVIGIHKGSISTQNYNIGRFLNVPLNDFIKKKYSNKFEENEIKSLINNSANIVYFEDNVKCKDNNYNVNGNNLSDNIINENIFKLSHNFNNIKILNLTFKNISYIDMDIFEEVNFENLEKLYLDNNKISDINFLEKVRFAELKELYLNSNNISNIDILEKVNIPNLERLDLSCNKILNIDVFEKVNFTKLKILSFHKNKLTNIDKIKLANLENLETLALSFNEGIDITPLKDVKFKNLNYLFIADINLKAIDILCSYSFKHLKILPLGGNNISNIKPLSKVDFKELESLFLFDNNISNIEVLAEVDFPQLKNLNLASNNITNIEVLKKVNFPELNELCLQQNKIVNINVFKNCRFKKLSKLNIKLNKIDIEKNIDVINELKSKLKLFK